MSILVINKGIKKKTDQKHEKFNKQSSDPLYLMHGSPYSKDIQGDLEKVSYMLLLQ